MCTVGGCGGTIGFVDNGELLKKKGERDKKTKHLGHVYPLAPQVPYDGQRGRQHHTAIKTGPIFLYIKKRGGGEKKGGSRAPTGTADSLQGTDRPDLYLWLCYLFVCLFVCCFVCLSVFLFVYLLIIFYSKNSDKSK